MFARLSPLSDLSQLGSDASGNGELALAWIELQNSQGVVARRQRLNCPPFQLPGVGVVASSRSSATQQESKHRTLVMCSATGKNSRQTSKRLASTQRLLRHQGMTKAHASPAASTQPLSHTTSSHQQQHRQQQAHHHHQQQHQQQQQQQQGIDPTQLTACIQAASTYSQLQAVCNTFLGHTAFSPQHAALVLARLHLVHSRPADSQLLLVELLAQLLPDGCCLLQQGQPGAAPGAQQQQQQEIRPGVPPACLQQGLSCGEVAAVCWAFSRVGYVPTPQLLQQLLQQFWLAFGQQQQQPQPQQPLQQQQPQPQQPLQQQPQPQQPLQQQPLQQQQQPLQQQQQQQQQVWPPVSPDEALATLVAGLAGLGCREGPCWDRIRAAVQVALSDCSTSSSSSTNSSGGSASSSSSSSRGSRVLPMHSLQQLTWGFAAVQQADPDVVDALACALQGRLYELESPEDLVQAVWCMHLMGCSNRQLYEQAAGLMVQQVASAAAGSRSGSSSSGSGSSRSTRRTPPAATAGGRGANNVCVGQQQQQQQQQRGPLLPQLPSIGRKGGGVSGGVGARAGSTPAQTPRQAAPCQQQAAAASPQRLLSAAAGQTAALCSAAASQAFGVLQQYDPLLCMLALYRDYYRPAQGV